MSTPLREFPGREAIQALHQLEWRYHTLKEDYEDAMDHREPPEYGLEFTFQWQRRDHLYEAESRLHHYLAGYYSFWRQVMTVGHKTEDPEITGRIENRRSQHDEEPAARVTRGLRMFVQKENVLPLLLYNSNHDDTTPKFAISLTDIDREGLYDPSFSHYFESVEGKLIFPFEVLESNWSLITELHQSVKDLVRTHMETELEDYRNELEALDEVSAEIVHPLLQDILPTVGSFDEELFEE